MFCFVQEQPLEQLLKKVQINWAYAGFTIRPYMELARQGRIHLFGFFYVDQRMELTL